MDYAQEYAQAAQRWHETDHGIDRGKPVKKSKFVEARPDDVPDNVPESFRDCLLCNPTEQGAQAARSNPYWYRVVAWEMDS